MNLQIAYFASLKAEEGRPATPRIVLTTSTEMVLPYRTLACFSPSRELTVETVAKLAHALAPGCALWITANDAISPNPVCRGILDCRGFPRPSFGLSLAVCDFSEGVYNECAMLDTWVLGPGELEVRYGFERCVLHAGQVRSFVPYHAVPYIQPLFEDGGRRLANVIREHGHNGTKYLRFWETFLPRDLAGWWSRVLKSTIARRHGGTFIFVADSHTEGQFKDNIGIDLDLGNAIAHFHVANCLMDPPVPEAAQDLSRQRYWLSEVSTQWLLSKSALDAVVDSVAAIANVDGCVVVNRQFMARCFGAKISTRNGCELPLVDWNNHSISLDSSMERLGTRNNSACHFCRTNPGAIAFVISQDQDLRVYCSDKDHAYAFEGLWVPNS